MAMNRRQFLKALGVGILAASLPIELVSTHPYFHPTKTYGSYVEFTDFADKEYLKLIIAELDEQIAEIIPPKFRKNNITYRIEQPGRIHAGDPWGIIGCASWKYTPARIG